MPYIIRDLCKAGRHAEAISHWEEDNHDEFNAFDYRFLSESAYKLEQYDLCQRIYEECHTRFPDDHKCDMYMSWVIYQHIKS